MTRPNFSIGYYSLLDISKFPTLMKLRDDLYNRNRKIIDLAKALATCGGLEALFDSSSDLSRILSNSSYIKFSSETPYDKFGKYNICDRIKAAADLASLVERSMLDDRVKSVLLKLLNYFLRFGDDCRDESNVRLKEIKDVLKGVDKKIYKDIFDGVEKLEDVNNNLIFSAPIYGMYFGKERVVVLFLNNIWARLVEMKCLPKTNYIVLVEMRSKKLKRHTLTKCSI